MQTSTRTRTPAIYADRAHILSRIFSAHMSTCHLPIRHTSMPSNQTMKSRAHVNTQAREGQVRKCRWLQTGILHRASKRNFQTPRSWKIMYPSKKMALQGGTGNLSDTGFVFVSHLMSKRDLPQTSSLFSKSHIPSDTYSGTHGLSSSSSKQEAPGSTHWNASSPQMNSSVLTQVHSQQSPPSKPDSVIRHAQTVTALVVRGALPMLVVGGPRPNTGGRDTCGTCTYRARCDTPTPCVRPVHETRAAVGVTS